MKRFVLFAIAGGIFLLAWAWFFMETGPGPEEELPASPGEGTGQAASGLSSPEIPSERERIPIQPVLDEDGEKGSERDRASHASIRSPGWKVRGTVRNIEGRPFAGARVRLSYYDGDETVEPLPPRTTGDDGVYSAFLPLPKSLCDRFRCGTIGVSIDGFAEAPGFHGAYRHDESPPAPDGEDPSIRMDFVLAPGPTLSGRVLGSGLRPVSGASVFIEFPKGKWEFVEKTDGEGFFCFSITKKIPQGVAASRFGEGTALYTPLTVAGKGDTRVPDLVLEGTGAIDGVAVYPDGRPVGGIGIGAFLESLQERGGLRLLEGLYWESEMSPVSLGDGGLTFEVARTNSQGLFRFSGLAEGRYFLVAEDCFDEGGPRPPVFETGRSGIRLVLDLHRVQVLLRDRKGRPIPHALVQYDCKGGSGAQDVVGGRFWFQCRTDPGDFMIAARTEDGNLRASKSVFIGPEDYETDLSLTLKAAPEQGCLRLFLHGSGNRPIRDFSLLLINQAWMVSMASRVFFTKKDADPDGGVRIEARPGTYLVRIIPGDREGTPPSGHSRDNFYLPLDKEGVKVLSGKETSLHLHARQGGRFRLTLIASGEEGAVRGLRFDLFKTEDGKECPLDGFFLSHGKGSVSVFSMKPNVPYLSANLLEGGTYRLVAEAAGYGKSETFFTIRAGEITDFTMMLKEK